MKPPDRLVYIEERCRDRVVLDIRRIRRVAARCVGVDDDKEEIEKLQREGFDAHDPQELTTIATGSR